MATLTDLGFCQGVIFENIICTFNSSGCPNVAPMGVTIVGEHKVSLTIYNSARTLKNLQNTRAATLNLTDDIDVYYRSALKSDEVSADLFERSSVVNAPKLKSCDAAIALSVESFTSVDMLRTKVVCNVEHVDALKKYPQAYCRAMSAVLEAIIHATRVKVLGNVEAEQGYVANLYGLIQNCVEVVNRSAPNSHYAELMSDLQEKVDLWRVRA
ncbi:MAG: DUF447 family protein [Candidatus Bathyarchaeota archaeon]|nr:DUF447 family protein [Candidatus Termiticorpusculum sp.]